MAAEPARKAPAPNNVQPIKPRKSRKLLWMLLAAVVLAAGAGGAWWALKGPAAVANTGASAAAQSAAPRPAPLYYKFDPAFVVNFGGEGSARYLQVTVEAMAREQGILDTLKDNEPAVRNDLVLLFSSQDNGTLMSTAGKEKLRTETLAAIRKVLDEVGAHGDLIEQVYFTSFVIQ